MSKLKMPIAALAGILFLTIFAAPVSAHEGTGTVITSQYSCADGTVEVQLNTFPKTFVWDGLKQSSHTNENWGEGYAAGKTLTDAKGWCRSRMVTIAAAKCAQKARTYGASSGSWWFQTTAYLYKATWNYYDYYNSYGYHETELRWPVYLTTQGSGTVAYSGTCSGPSQVP